jgi:hypothetical protein
VGGPATSFGISFTAPATTGVHGHTRLFDEVTAQTATASTDCVGSATVPVLDVRRGQRVKVRLDPKLLGGGRWCRGLYHGRVLALQTLVCPPGSYCPTYVRLVAVIGRFTFTVGPPSADRVAPTFAGLQRAFACTPGPQRPGQTTPYNLSWQPAHDNRTPAASIVYDVYYSPTPGGEQLARPTWMTAPGVTTFRTPGLPSHGPAYFVVRARDTAGNEDSNTREVAGVDPCL